MKILLNVIGSIAVVLAILGIFLPLLPTTPFLLLASACYIRGSERMHRWLMNHRLFGDYLRNIQERRGMPLRGKVITLVLMWASLGYSIYTVNAMLLKGLLVVIGIGVTTFILRMKTLHSALDSTTRKVDERGNA
jgi:uncharacterized protein